MSYGPTETTVLHQSYDPALNILLAPPPCSLSPSFAPSRPSFLSPFYLSLSRSLVLYNRLAVMFYGSMKRLLNNPNYPNKRVACSIIHKNQSHWTKGSKLDPTHLKEDGHSSNLPIKANSLERANELNKYSSDEDELGDSRWKMELAWLTKALEPALQFCRRALPAGNGSEYSIPPISRSFTEILASFQKSKSGIQDWSLSDLTIGLYLVYLRQGSANPLDDIKGTQIFSEQVVQDLIYHIELAKGCYKGSASGLAKHSMLRESNVLKYVKNSSILRPGYYIGIDPRKKLVILGIRGTHTVYDLITDIVSSGSEEVTFEGYSTHFGTAEAARWFLTHEMGFIKRLLDENQGYKLRLVGHSLGAAIASLLAIMIRNKSPKELGFSPDTVTAVGFATPPCVSKELAEVCSDFVSSVVMQDDIIPRLSIVTLARLRNEIVQTDWKSVLEKEDWKDVIELVSNVKQALSSVQDVARKVADYANFRGSADPKDSGKVEISKPLPRPDVTSSTASTTSLVKKVETTEELFVPGTVYYLKRSGDMSSDTSSGDNGSTTKSKGCEYYTLWKRHPGQHFQRILLSSRLISDHKCDSHRLALRDVLKGFAGPETSDEAIFR